MLPLTLCRTLYATILIVATLAGSPPMATAETDFYAFGPSDLRGPPGTLIRSKIVPGGPANATSYRVLYRSLGMDGRTTAVSGMVMIPISPPPPDGRPIVAWAHPTTGVEDQCAPSLARVFFASVQGLNEMLNRGYIVTATDYSGLGTAGPHPYLVGVSEGRAVPDSVRAAAALPGASADASPSGGIRKAAALCSSLDFWPPSMRPNGVSWALPPQRRQPNLLPS